MDHTEYGLPNHDTAAGRLRATDGRAEGEIAHHHDRHHGQDRSSDGTPRQVRVMFGESSRVAIGDTRPTCAMCQVRRIRLVDLTQDRRLSRCPHPVDRPALES